MISVLQWASTLAEQSSLIHSDEIKRREVFLMEVGKILKSLNVIKFNELFM